MILFLYMLCFSQATVSVKVGNFFLYFLFVYPTDNFKKRKCYRKYVSLYPPKKNALFMYYGWDFSGSNFYFIILYYLNYE